MTKDELTRFIELLTKLRDNYNELTWGEMNELRMFSYHYGDFIQKEWEEW